MMRLTDLIFTVDDLLTDEECDFIIEDFGKNKISRFAKPANLAFTKLKNM